jgi:hypothetical protein
MVGGFLRVLWLLPPLKLVAMDASYVEDDNTYIKTASVSMNTRLIFIALFYGVLIRLPTGFYL